MITGRLGAISGTASAARHTRHVEVAQHGRIATRRFGQGRQRSAAVLRARHVQPGLRQQCRCGEGQHLVIVDMADTDFP